MSCCSGHADCSLKPFARMEMRCYSARKSRGQLLVIFGLYAHSDRSMKAQRSILAGGAVRSLEGRVRTDLDHLLLLQS